MYKNSNISEILIQKCIRICERNNLNKYLFYSIYHNDNEKESISTSEGTNRERKKTLILLFPEI